MTAIAEKTCLKFRGDAKELAELVSVVASVAPAKSTRPVLQNLLLEGRDGCLELTATDMEVSIRALVEQVEVSVDGTVLVNASRFQQILRELSGDQIEFSADERGCTIATGDARFQVMGGDAEDFPEVSRWSGEGAFEIASAGLLDMIQRTHFATHPEKTRYAMNGILLDLKEQRLQVVATDGKRLSLCEQPLQNEVETPVHVVVPTKGMTLLQRLLASGEERVEIAVSGAHVQMRGSRAMVAARLIEGHFPPYEEVLPPEQESKLRLPREAFICALRRASLLGTKDTQAVRFAFSREGLELTARVPEVGESRVTFPMDFPFDELEIGFNPAYFIDALKILKSTEFDLELKDNKSAAVIRERHEDGRRFVYLVMPLNLGA